MPMILYKKQAYPSTCFWSLSVSDQVFKNKSTTKASKRQNVRRHFGLTAANGIFVEVFCTQASVCSFCDAIGRKRKRLNNHFLGIKAFNMKGVFKKGGSL
jgi:hypothetical protein